MKRFLLKLSMYGAISLLLMNILGWLGDETLRKSCFFKPSFLVNNFEREGKMDYVILGSSRGLTTLNSMLIDKKLGLNGINLAMDDTDLKTHNLMLKHFFNNGFKTDYCILTLDDSNFEKTQLKLGDNDYKFSPFINKKYVQNHFREYETIPLKPNYNSRLFPFIRYAYYNVQLVPASLISLVMPNKRHRFDEKGNFSYPSKQAARQTSATATTKTAQINNPLVEEMKKLCEQNNSKLIVYIAPYRGLTIKLNESAYLINHSGLITSSNYFFDRLHVNSEGRQFATLQFITEMKKILGTPTQN